MFKYRLNPFVTKTKFISRFFTENVAYTCIKVSNPTQNVGLIQLNRPKAKNALNNQLIKEINEALNKFDNDNQVGCVVLGGEKDYFAAGADIKEMKDRTFPDVYDTKMLDDWNKITKIKYDCKLI
jgi:enoyl-CoA hydratase/carnithine racemase